VNRDQKRFWSATFWLIGAGLALSPLLFEGTYGCTPQPLSPVDASDAAIIVVVAPDGAPIDDGATLACSNLVHLGCPTGSDALCVNRLRSAVALKKATAKDLDCALHAGNRAALASCNYVVCE